MINAPKNNTYTSLNKPLTMADQGLEVFFMFADIFCVGKKDACAKTKKKPPIHFAFFLNCQFSCMVAYISIIPNAEMSSVKSPY